MTAPLRIAADLADMPRPVARVATVAAMLDCEPGDIRKMVRTGELEAHGKGVRGIRIYLDSVRAYQERKAVLPVGQKQNSATIDRRRAPSSTASYREAMARAKALGIV